MYYVLLLNSGKVHHVQLILADPTDGRAYASVPACLSVCLSSVRNVCIVAIGIVVLTETLSDEANRK